MSLLAALSLLAAGCASSGGAIAATPATQTVRVAADATTIGMGISTLKDAQTRTISAPLDEVWRVLPGVLDTLGIPITTRDAATGEVGTSGLEVRRLLGGTIVSRYFTCGGNLNGASAVSFDLFLQLMVHATANPAGGTSLTTTISTRGKPITTSGDWIPCESTGLLEQRIAERVEARATH